jgi:NTE family protein
MARHFLLVTLLTFFGAGEPISPVRAEEHARPRIGLVLGGGGARGAAHIGVIRVLEELQVPIDVVVGTSMGAIIGGLYAAGNDADRMEAILASIDWNQTLRDTPRRSEQPMRRKEEDLQLAVRYRLGLGLGGPIAPPGAIEGQHLQTLLRRVLQPVHHVRDFDELPLPFRAVATDLATGEAVVLSEGDLVLAIRSSMSVPGAFAPVGVDGRVFVDGGVVDNVPVDVARSLGAEVVIAVDVSSDLPELADEASALGVSLRATQILLENRTRGVLEQLQPTDVLLDVDLGDMSGSAFGRSLEAVPEGEAAAREAAEALRRHSIADSEYAEWRARHRTPVKPRLIVTEIRVDDADAPGAAGMVRARLKQKAGQPLDLSSLERDLDRIYAVGRFSLVDYSLEPTPGGVALVVRPRDKSWGPTLLRFGLGLTDDFQGGLDYRVTVETLTHGLDRRGREWRNRIDLGRPTGVRSELYQPLDVRARWFVAGYSMVRQSDYTFSVQGERIAEVGLRTVEAGLSFGRNLDQSNEVRLGARVGHLWLEQRVGLPGLIPDSDAARGQLTAEIAHDTFDDFSLPSKGNRSVLEAVWTREELGSEADNLLMAGQVNQALHLGQHCLLLGVSGGGIASGQTAESEAFLLGGQFRLSGYRVDELLGAHFALARLIYYNNNGLSRVALLGTPLYYGFSLEAGQTWFENEVVDLTQLRYAGSAFAGFDTVLGPIFLSYGRAEHGRSSLYFSFGPLFGFGRERLFRDP